MHAVVRAPGAAPGERVRRSNVKKADGERIKLKTIAEGQMAAVIAVSKGDMEVKKIKAKAQADSKILIAKAEATAIGEVGEALSEFGIDPSDYMVSLKYVDAFTKLGSLAKKRTVFMPFETDVTGVGGSMFADS